MLDIFRVRLPRLYRCTLTVECAEKEEQNEKRICWLNALQNNKQICWLYALQNDKYNCWLNALQNNKLGREVSIIENNWDGWDEDFVGSC